MHSLITLFVHSGRKGLPEVRAPMPRRHSGTLIDGAGQRTAAVMRSAARCQPLRVTRLHCGKAVLQQVPDPQPRPELPQAVRGHRQSQ